MSCINTKAHEYVDLKQKSGAPNYILEAVCRDTLDRYGRWPHLDEIPGSNSSEHLKDAIKVRKDSSSKIENILKYTGKDSIEESIPYINDQYRDLEVDITPIINDAIVDIKQRPLEDSFNSSDIEVDAEPNSFDVMQNVMVKLGSLYGINFNMFTSEQIEDLDLSDIPDVSLYNAFVYNGQIYINLDRANVDAPLHEMMHIFMGSMRFTNNELYQSLIDSVENFPNYKELASQFLGRTRNDINEEILVLEVAKHLCGLESEIMNLDDRLKYEISYNVRRVLDSVLMGESSVSSISQPMLFDMSLHEVAQLVNSSIMTNNFNGYINAEGSELHRKLNNMKSDLMKEGQLEEICD